MLMAWWRKGPEQQHPWYWPSFPGKWNILREIRSALDTGLFRVIPCLSATLRTKRWYDCHEILIFEMLVLTLGYRVFFLSSWSVFASCITENGDTDFQNIVRICRRRHNKIIGLALSRLSGMSDITQGTIWYILGRLRLIHWIQDFFLFCEFALRWTPNNSIDDMSTWSLTTVAPDHKLWFQLMINKIRWEPTS